METLKRRIFAFKAAGKGIRHLFLHEIHFRIHILITVFVSFAGWYYDLNKLEWVCIVLCIGLVWTAEAFNTAVERWTDLAEQKQLPLAGLVKDLAAAAVLFSAITAVITACIIFIPKVF